MIEGNVIKFGYGTVAVGDSWFPRALTVDHIEPPKEIGEQIPRDGVERKTRLTFEYDEKEMKDFLSRLQDVRAESPTLEFRGHVFDFTNFNRGSVDVVARAVTRILQRPTLVLAC